MGASVSYPEIPGESYDSLDKQGRITFSEDADTIEVVQRFKKKTGVDLFSLKGSEFASTVNALMAGREIAGKFKAPPSKYSFYHNLRIRNRGITEPASNYAYDYFFKDPETPEDKEKRIESGEKTDAQKAADAAKDARVANVKKDQTFLEWLFGSTDDTEKTGTDASKPKADTPVPSSFSSMTSTATAFSPLTSMAPNSNPVSTLTPATGTPSPAIAGSSLSGLSMDSLGQSISGLASNANLTPAPVPAATPAPVPVPAATPAPGA